ncbi:SNF2 family N-terminal domain-containing protein [Trichoderma austrokoningii]
MGPRDMKNDKDSNLTQDHNLSALPFHLAAPVQEAPRMEPSLFVDNNENTMNNVQVAEKKIGAAEEDDLEDCHVMTDKRIVEVDNTAEEERHTLVLEADTDDEDDTLLSLDDIIDQELANIQLQGDNIDVAKEEEEEEDPDYEGDNSVSSGNDCDDEAPQRSKASASAKKSSKPRRKAALNAREYVARLHEEEDHKNARKRKQDEGKRPGANSSRKRKLAESDSGPLKILKMASGNSCVTSTSSDHPLLPAQSVKANTHACQIAQIMDDVPVDYDLGRKTTQKKDLREAMRLFGFKRVEAVDGAWRLKPMQTLMRNHQLTATAWMVKRELSRTKPFGGILADAMGMGKTVMSLACIIGNQADEEHLAKYCRATLVVVPSKAIALQWEAEVRVSIETSAQMTISTKLIELATYKELMMQYPENAVLTRLSEKYGSDDISFHREKDRITGHLFHINWYRIILDEAHAIKNHDSRKLSVRCQANIDGPCPAHLFPTVLTMYPYMKFTECDMPETHRKFRKEFYFRDEPNAEFEALTSLIMYRR